MKKDIDWWQIENGLFAEEYRAVCGVDEAGRGPLAGPVCAAAVILPRGLVIEGLDDSKKLSPKKREELYGVITENAVAWGAAFAEVEEIERLNILGATYLAMNRAIERLRPAPDIAVIDGNRSTGIRCTSRCVVGGDGLSESVAAASVIAKVTRDRLLVRLDAEYPEYGFAKHKGYGTREHYEMLRKYGPCKIHRMSFLKNMH